MLEYMCASIAGAAAAISFGCAIGATREWLAVRRERRVGPDAFTNAMIKMIEFRSQIVAENIRGTNSVLDHLRRQRAGSGSAE